MNSRVELPDLGVVSVRTNAHNPQIRGPSTEKPNEHVNQYTMRSDFNRIHRAPLGLITFFPIYCYNRCTLQEVDSPI